MHCSTLAIKLSVNDILFEFQGYSFNSYDAASLWPKGKNDVWATISHHMDSVFTNFCKGIEQNFLER